MNIYGNVFLQISMYLKEGNNYKKSRECFEKAIAFNTENKCLNQSEIDDLLKKYANKSIEINKSLFDANIDLLKKDKDNKKVLLFLTEKYFKLDGLAPIFFQITKNNSLVNY